MTEYNAANQKVFLPSPAHYGICMMADTNISTSQAAEI